MKIFIIIVAQCRQPKNGTRPSTIVLPARVELTYLDYESRVLTVKLREQVFGIQRSFIKPSLHGHSFLLRHFPKGRKTKSTFPRSPFP